MIHHFEYEVLVDDVPAHLLVGVNENGIVAETYVHGAESSRRGAWTAQEFTDFLMSRR